MRYGEVFHEPKESEMCRNISCEMSRNISCEMSVISDTRQELRTRSRALDNNCEISCHV